MKTAEKLNIEVAAETYSLAPSIILSSLMLLLEDGIVLKDQTELDQHLVKVLF
jgi:hypothetical protein